MTFIVDVEIYREKYKNYKTNNNSGCNNWLDKKPSHSRRDVTIKSSENN